MNNLCFGSRELIWSMVVVGWCQSPRDIELCEDSCMQPKVG
jgi:hypothetical protein